MISQEFADDFLRWVSTVELEPIAEATEANYKRLYAEVASGKKRLEVLAAEGKASAYYLYRAAVMRISIIKAKAALQDPEKKIEELKAIANLFNQLSPKGFFGEGGTPITYKEMRKEFKNKSIEVKAPVKNSKKMMLSKLPPGWEEQVYTKIKNKYQISVAVFTLTGCRPAEYKKGILYRRTQDGGIEFLIKGAKISAFRGQEIRVIESEIPEYMKILFNEKESSGVLTPPLHLRSLNTLLRDVGHELFKDIKQILSPYTFRHWFADKLRKEGHSEVQIAGAMGHQTGESQCAYGIYKRKKRKGGKGGVGLVKAIYWRTPIRIDGAIAPSQSRGFAEYIDKRSKAAKEKTKGKGNG